MTFSPFCVGLNRFMSIIVETGEGLTNSNSYASVSAADAHYTDRPSDVWSGASASEKATALIKATDYIDATYIFRSVPLSATQALQNPRYPDEIIHPLLIKATIMLAVHMLTDDINPKVTDREVIESTKSLDGVGSQTVKYDPKTRATDPYPAITRTLATISNRRGAGGGSMRMIP